MGRSRRRILPAGPAVAKIDALSDDGRGLARVDDKTVLLHGALPGEEVSFFYTRKRGPAYEGEVEKILRPSPDRVEPGCPWFGLCGGCSLQHLEPAAQIRSKQQLLMDSFQRVAQIQPTEILPPLTTDSSWGYRKKARLGVKYVAKKGKVLVGFRERGSGFLADIDRCLILDPRVGELITPLADLIDGLSIRERIPQIEVAIGDQTCVLIIRVLVTPSADDRRALLAFGTAYNVDIYLQEGGPETVYPLSGETADLFYDLTEHQVRIHFKGTDFTQVNTGLNRLMVEQALRLLDPQPEDRLLDLFCGLGNFTLPLARRCRQVVGVEGDKGLVARARGNAEANGIENIGYYTADLYAPLAEEPWLKSSFNKALLDPPRSGAAEVLEYLPQLGIERIVYVSCYPETLARDAGLLVNQHGYRLVSAGVMDMFPHTAHVESIALFGR